MPIVSIEPTSEFPIPYSWEDEELTTFTDELTVSGETAELMALLGAPIEVSPEDYEREKN